MFRNRIKPFQSKPFRITILVNRIWCHSMDVSGLACSVPDHFASTLGLTFAGRGWKELNVCQNLSAAIYIGEFIGGATDATMQAPWPPGLDPYQASADAEMRRDGDREGVPWGPSLEPSQFEQGTKRSTTATPSRRQRDNAVKDVARAARRCCKLR